MKSSHAPTDTQMTTKTSCEYLHKIHETRVPWRYVLHFEDMGVNHRLKYPSVILDNLNISNKKKMQYKTEVLDSSKILN